MNFTTSKYTSRAEARETRGTWRPGDAIERRVELTRAMRELLDTCDAESRELTRDERRQYNEFDGELDRIGADLREHEASQGSSSLPDWYVSHEGEPIRAGTPVLGESGEVLTREQRVADWTRSRPHTLGEDDLDPEPGARRFALGRAVRGMVSGHWDGAELERRVLAEGTDSAGGFLTPEILSGPIIDAVRNQARVMQAGARTVPLDSDKQSLPRIATGSTGAWRKENEEVGGTDPEFERIDFAPKTLAVLVKMSMELFEDLAVGAAEAIERDITRALAVELDRAALRGSGVDPEPTGILNQEGVNTKVLAANGETPTSFAPLTSAVGRLLQLNHEPNGIIYSAREATTFGELTDEQKQPLRRPSLLDGVTEFSSNQVPTNLTVGTAEEECGEIYTGQWEHLLIGVRPQVGIRVKQLDQTFADKMQIGLLAWLRADVQLAHPAAFDVTTGVKA